MAKLSSPYEVFDIGGGEAVQVRVMSIEKGEIDIHPGYGAEVKTVEALRLHLAHRWIEGRLPYIDVTSGRLRVQLEPMVATIPPEGKLIRITKRGIAPKAFFEVLSLPG